MRINTWRGSVPLAVIWILLISVLCFLPGSAFPKQDWLDEVSFDKWVHFGLFAVLLFLWRFHFPYSRPYHFILFGLSVVYGFGVETIQHYFISNRSFDLYDVVADMAGSIAGLWFWARVYIKK
ncbi:MAG TPA: VanZ family protein [Flavisolibacter sp.]|jgi:VanZ family protein|nr:VanZ family protein [Flavisolibacter sp.]